jgi:GTP-binding protein
MLARCRAGGGPGAHARALPALLWTAPEQQRQQQRWPQLEQRQRPEQQQVLVRLRQQQRRALSGAGAGGVSSVSGGPRRGARRARSLLPPERRSAPPPAPWLPRVREALAGLQPDGSRAAGAVDVETEIAAAAAAAEAAAAAAATAAATAAGKADDARAAEGGRETEVERHIAELRRKGVPEQLVSPLLNPSQPYYDPERDVIVEPGTGRLFKKSKAAEASSTGVQATWYGQEDEEVEAPRQGLGAASAAGSDPATSPSSSPSPSRSPSRSPSPSSSSSSSSSSSRPRHLSAGEALLRTAPDAGEFSPDLEQLDRERLVSPCELGRLVWALPFSDPPEMPPAQLFNEARRIFQAGSDYLGPAQRAAHLAKLNSDSPQVCFLGRSNVGKSSLLNALFASSPRKSSDKSRLAQVSKTPGRTKLLHAFGAGRNDGWKHRRSLPHFRVVLVDCPGYGFARIDEAGSRAMGKAIAEFMENRDQVLFARAYLLLDSGVGVTPLDLEMMNMLETLGIKFTPVLTKCDRHSRSELERTVEQTLKHLHAFTGTADALFGVATKGESATSLVDRLRADVVFKADNHFFRRKRSAGRSALFGKT